MKKLRYLIIILLIGALLFLIPNVVNATDNVTVTKNVYSINGSMKFTFSGLTLDTTHEYKFGITKQSNDTISDSDWYSIPTSDITETQITVDLATTNTKIAEIINEENTAYITIKDVTANTVTLPAYDVNLIIPFLKVTDNTVINNEKEFTTSDCINVALRNADNSKAYYQYEKVTDEAVINKYREIKAKNGSVTEMESMLKTTTPGPNWTEWTYFNGHSSDGNGGKGYPEVKITAPDTGLYYMWFYFQGNDVKDIYGYVLVDNLGADVEIPSISLPKTETVELDKTLTLTPTFNPSTTTEEVLIWTSSDETVAIVDSTGKVTPKKVGATIITVSSQDGTKKATCTVTVTVAGTGNVGASGNDGSLYSKDLPKTGVGMEIIIAMISVLSIGVFTVFKYNKLRDIR